MIDPGKTDQQQENLAPQPVPAQNEEPNVPEQLPYGFEAGDSGPDVPEGDEEANGFAHYAPSLDGSDHANAVEADDFALPMQQAVPPTEDLAAIAQPAARHTHRRPTKSYLREILEMVLLSILFFFGWQSLIGQRVVDGLSMEPNFHTDERVLINQVEYFHIDFGKLEQLIPGVHPQDTGITFPFGGPHRGDVVVLTSRIKSEDLIKRVIGLPGDTVEVRCAATGRNCQTYVNNQLLDEPYINEPMTTPYPPTKIPAGQLLVMGDNRNNSYDGRSFGPVAMDDIVGHAFAIIWPTKNLEFIPKPVYKNPQLR